jgi:hypothetical protein
MDVAVKVALNHSDTTRSHKSSSYCRYAKEITLFPFRHFEGEQISFQFFTPDRWCNILQKQLPVLTSYVFG